MIVKADALATSDVANLLACHELTQLVGQRESWTRRSLHLPCLTGK